MCMIRKQLINNKPVTELRMKRKLIAQTALIAKRKLFPTMKNVQMEREL